MKNILITARLLFIIFIGGLLVLPIRADDTKETPQQTEEVQSSESKDTATEEAAKKPAKKTEEKKDDIWEEVPFESSKDLQITEKQVNEVLQQLKKSDPKKAEQIEKLKENNAEEFFKAIREEIEKSPSKKPEPTPKTDPEWEQYFQTRRENFLEWYKKKYPEDHAKLIALKTSDPEIFAKQTMDLFSVYEQIRGIERHDPKLAEAMMENLELQKIRDSLLLQIRVCTKSEYNNLVIELKAVVSKRFDTIVMEKQLKYEWLSRRLDRLTKTMEKRAAELDTLKKSKDQSVEKRLNDLLERTETMKGE